MKNHSEKIIREMSGNVVDFEARVEVKQRCKYCEKNKFVFTLKLIPPQIRQDCASCGKYQKFHETH